MKVESIFTLVGKIDDIKTTRHLGFLRLSAVQGVERLKDSGNDYYIILSSRKQDKENYVFYTRGFKLLPLASKLCLCLSFLNKALHM